MTLRWRIFDVSLHLCSLASPRSGRHCASWFSHGLGRCSHRFPPSPALAPWDTGRVVGTHSLLSCRHGPSAPLCLEVARPACCPASALVGRRLCCLLVSWSLGGELCARHPPPPACGFSLQGNPRCVGERCTHPSALSWHAAGKQPGGTTGDHKAGPPYGVHLPCRVGAATATLRVRAAGFAPGLRCGKVPSKRPFLLFVCVRVIKSWCCFIWKVHKRVNPCCCVWFYMFYDSCC